MSDLVQPVTDLSFQDDVLKSDVPVLIDVWAPWCGPCRALAPIVDSVANDYGPGRLKVRKIDADQNPNVLTKYGIRGIPALLMFEGGTLKASLVGYQPRSAIDKALQNAFPELASASATAPAPAETQQVTQITPAPPQP